MITTVTPNVALDKYYLVPGFHLRGVHWVQQAHTLPSGKGLNVARVLHHLGVPVVSTGVVAGYTGQQVCHLLDLADQKHDFVWAEGESRLCLTVLDPANDVHTEILESGPVYTEQVADALQAAVHRLAAVSDYVAISGNPPTGTAANLLYHLVQTAKAAGAHVLLDAREDWLREGVKAQPHFIKPNWQEFTDLVGPCASVKEAVVRAEELLASGIELVLISLGASGALAVTSSGAWAVRPPHVPVVSPVGCGDALVGGLLAAYAAGQPLLEALVFATSIAASNACHLGAGEFTDQQAEDFRTQVKVERLA